MCIMLLKQIVTNVLTLFGENGILDYIRTQKRELNFPNGGSKVVGRALLAMTSITRKA